MPDNASQAGILNLDDSQLAAIRGLVLSDTVDGFEVFYTLIHNRPLPRHAKEWIALAYRGRVENKPVLIEAFRGSTKTTTFNTFDAYLLGLAPHKTDMLIQAGDESAARNAGEIANIIEYNPMWKLLFPHVVPDKDQSWGAGGYEVRRTDMDYGEFRRMRSPDASLVGYGYKSQSIIGKHPSNMLRGDDILSEENTSSERELAHVIKTVTDTIMPTRSPNNPMTVFIGTPWTENDMLAKQKASGEFLCAKTPVYDAAGLPVWPEGFPEEKIQTEKRLDLTGGISFARMFLLDLTAAHNRVFVHHPYPSHLINTVWPMVGGVDYASVFDPNKRGQAGQSHFALAYVAKVPGGGAVVFDGVLEQCSQGEAEEFVTKAQSMFPNYLMSVVEGDGKGEDFIQVLYRNPNMRIVPMKTGGKHKTDRLVKQMGPWLRSGRVRISDADTKFLSALRHFLNAYPNVEQHDKGWDAADAVYWALRGLPDVLAMPTEDEELPVWGRRKKAEHPFNSFANQHA